MKISQKRAFISGLKSTNLSNKEILFLKKYKPWGIILFERNIRSLDQTKKLIQSIKKIFKDQNYPILIDEEGGRVNRLKKIIDTKLHSSKFFGDMYKKDKKKSLLYYKIYIDQISYLLNNLGININTVPVLDIAREKTSKVIGDRSFSKNKKIVNIFGNFTIDQFHKNNIATVIKHIPGHGLGKVDSHYKLPIINNSNQYLLKNDFLTFKNKNSLFAMTGHLLFKKIDNLNSVTHSKKIIKLIRNKINFKNLIMSDDISMKALPYGIKNNVIKAFTAGCDLVLHCNANLKEMHIVAENSPKLSKFIIKITNKYYKLVSNGESRFN
tara:strand:+ start:1361 stop:2335 length:975 start_codon:yes stop_codon:yes gene_type:complete